MFYVYLLKSKMSKHLYVGSTNNLTKRLREHNSGDSYFTNLYKPWTLIYYEAYSDEHTARLREKQLKRHGKVYQELKKRLGLL